jgi:uncharacterized protein YxjI
MTAYFIKQAVFSWADRFSIKNEAGEDCFIVQGKVWSWGHDLTMTDESGNEVAQIKQKMWSFMPTYEIFSDGRLEAKLTQKLSLVRQKFTVDGLGWQIVGNLLDHEFSVLGMDGETIATISKEWFTWGDSYRVEVNPEARHSLVLALVIAVDAVAADNDSASSILNM